MRVLMLSLLLACPSFGQALNNCDLTADGVVNILDVQQAANMGLGKVACPAPLVCNIILVQRIVNYALGVSPCLVGGHTVDLTWTASTSLNVIGGNVYRSTTPAGPFTKLNASLVVGTAYTDSGVIAGQTYYYAVTAVDNLFNESVFSVLASAVIPSP